MWRKVGNLFLFLFVCVNNLKGALALGTVEERLQGPCAWVFKLILHTSC